MSTDPQKPALTPSPDRSGLLDGIARLSGMDALTRDEEKTPLARMLETQQARRALADLLPHILNIYAGKSPLKKRIAGPVGRHLKRRFLEGEEGRRADDLKRLFSDPRFIQEIAGPAAEILRGLFEVISGVAAGIEALDTEEKKKLLSELMAKALTGQTGTLITQGCRILNDIHKDDPTFFAKALEPGVKAWITSMDFGELKTAMENAAADTHGVVEMVIRVLWQYPTKMVLLISLLPTIGNMILDAAGITLNQINQISSDLFADVILTFLKEVDAKAISRVIGETAELMRKLDNGSRLLGEPGSPQLPRAIGTLVDTLTADIDPLVLAKAGVAAAGIKAAVGEAVAEAVTCREDLRKTVLDRSLRVRNIRVRSLNRRLGFWESADDDELAGYLAGYDIQGLGDALNALLVMFNRVCDRQPELLPAMAEKLAAAIDLDELQKAAGRVFDQSAESLKGPARAFLPKIITWICGVISPEDDEYEEDAARARQALADLFAIQEAR